MNQDKETIYYEIQTNMNICDGKWHDILLTWDGTTNVNSIKLYIDDMTKPVAQVTTNGIGKNSQDIYAGSCLYEPADFPPLTWTTNSILIKRQKSVKISAATITSIANGATIFTLPAILFCQLYNENSAITPLELEYSL